MVAMSTPATPMHTVRHGFREDAPVASIEITRTYDGTVSEVWDALTTAERLPRWFAPVSGDLSLGGRFQIEGNAAGSVTECHPPRGFSTTWEFAGDVSWLDVEVAEVTPERTVVRIAHTVPTDNDHWRQFGPSAVGLGWDLTAEGLAMYLADGGGDVRAAGEAWASGPDGAEFLRRCGESWFAADTRGGTPEAEARPRADASVGFFTAEPDAG